MKKLTFPLIVVIVLAVIAGALYYSNSGGTIKKELRDFAIEDTAAVTKIFLADKNNHCITLERKNGIWVLNNDFIARKDLINVMLKTLARLNVKTPVAKSAHNTIIKSLAANGIKTEVYTNEKLSKVFYVGGSTPDNLGTYMLLEGSSVPFVMDIPGFSGYLTTRFTTDINEWKDRNVFCYKFTDIASVSVENPSAPTQSFKILNYGNNKFGLQSLSDKKEISKFDTLSVKEYASAFKLLNFENYVSDLPQARIDSVLHSVPIQIVTIEDRAGKRKSIKMFYRPNLSGLYDKDGKQFPFDPDRMYAFINNDKDMIIIQYFVFDPVIKELNYFLKMRSHF